MSVLSRTSIVGCKHEIKNCEHAVDCQLTLSTFLFCELTGCARYADCKGTEPAEYLGKCGTIK